MEIFRTSTMAMSGILPLPITMETQWSSAAMHHFHWLDPGQSPVLVESGPNFLSALVRRHFSN